MSFESKLETRRDDFVHGHNGTDEKIMVGDDSIDMLGSSVKSATTTSIRSGKSLWSSPSSSPTKVSHSILDTSGEDGVDCEMGISEAKRSKETDVSEHLKVTPVRGNSTSVRGDKDDGNARGKGSDSYILQTIPTSCFREFIIKFAVHNRWVVTSMIVTLGIAAAIAFMFLGIESSRRFDDQYFTQTGQGTNINDPVFLKFPLSIPICLMPRSFLSFLFFSFLFSLLSFHTIRLGKLDQGTRKEQNVIALCVNVLLTTKFLKFVGLRHLLLTVGLARLRDLLTLGTSGKRLSQQQCYTSKHSILLDKNNPPAHTHRLFLSTAFICD